MSALLPAIAAAGPLAAGWSLHVLRLRSRIEVARRDPLTGLPTRAAFTEQAVKALAAAPCAVYLIDLDRFKQVNDTYGHAAGDAVLRAAGERLTRWAELNEGTPARLGGDEFAAITPVRSRQEHTWLLEDLARAMKLPVQFEEHSLTVDASIGSVAYDPRTDEGDLPTLLRVADEHMYAAKRAGAPWLNALSVEAACATVNGRRAGRRGAQPPARGTS
ncbi:GGDEF domain-containing protein [Streptomyces sp. SCA3-4]|uniref:GGDEF domain-containing protein n=1 Tax=Streptomyces sichuanensis TaxID=2871810 RepID=UPI001CE2CFFA|nr:GGDEF domain-containing protein [Streptomyces sichuanensis]MCA6094024.1 GGDEF domain-containing protein [Streptomyces sichuanensis]